MAASKGIRIQQKSLEDAVREGLSHITKTFVDDAISRSEDRDAIRKAFAGFIGAYKAVKKALREEGTGAGIAYFEREALLDSYSANIAANEALEILLSQGISKTKDTKGFFRNSLDFRKYEKDAVLRERLVVGELMTRYLEATASINPGMMAELSINYFEWVMLQTAKTRDLMANASFERMIRNSPIVMPTLRIYSGFRLTERLMEREGKPQKTKNSTDNKSIKEEGAYRTECPFLVRNIPNVTFKDIGGLERQKEMIYDAIKLPIECRDEFREKGVEAAKGLIFYGPPGTGKTFIAKALANELGMPFFYASGPEFRKKYLGDGPKMVRQLFADARTIAPSIIFIDEVDACMRDRDSDDGRYSMDIVNQMLTEIDGFNPLDSVKVVVATNNYNALDGTFCDRFPVNCHLEFGLPDTVERLKALKAITEKMKTGSLNLELLAGQTEGANFRALRFICNQAGIYSIKEHSACIEQRHLDLSLSAYLSNPGRYGLKKEG